MALKYCPECGTPLEEDATTCPNCDWTFDAWIADFAPQVKKNEAEDNNNSSTKAESSDENDPKDQAEKQDSEESSSESKTVETDAADDTQEDDYQEAGPTGAVAYKPLRRDTTRLRRTDGWSNNNKLFAYLGGGILGVFVLVILSFQACSPLVNDPQLARVTPGGYVEDQQAEEERTEEEKKEEDPNYVKVRDLYADLDDIAQRVEQAEGDFAENWKSERATRTELQTDFTTLQSEVSDYVGRVNNTLVDESSEWNAQYLLIEECANKLTERCELIQEWWRYDLLYNYPQYYEGDILYNMRSNQNEAGELTLAVEYQEAYDKIEL